jgi:hypothetical protein
VVCMPLKAAPLDTGAVDVSRDDFMGANLT